MCKHLVAAQARATNNTKYDTLVPTTFGELRSPVFKPTDRKRSTVLLCYQMCLFGENASQS